MSNTKPAHRIDSHCHIYPDRISRKAVKAVDTFYDGLPADHHDGTVHTLLESGRNCGIDHFIVHSVATSPAQVSSINHFIAEAVKTSEGRFTGLGTMHLDSEDLKRDFLELMRLGLSGVKLHPDIQHFNADDDRAMRIYEMCEEEGLPVCVHTGDYRYDYSNPPRIVNILKTFPRLTLIGAHFGGWSVWDEAKRQLPDYPNIVADTSSSFFWLKKEEAMDIIRAYGSERIMFGTDYPLWKQEPEIEYLDSLDLTEEEYEDICWRTCSRLFHINLEDGGQK